MPGIQEVRDIQGNSASGVLSVSPRSCRACLYDASYFPGFDDTGTFFNVRAAFSADLDFTSALRHAFFLIVNSLFVDILYSRVHLPLTGGNFYRARLPEKSLSRIMAYSAVFRKEFELENQPCTVF